VFLAVLRLPSRLRLVRSRAVRGDAFERGIRGGRSHASFSLSRTCAARYGVCEHPGDATAECSTKRGTSHGRVHVTSGAPRVTYTASENSRRLLDFHVERARESLTQAGARSVDSLTLMRSAGWHLLGTARMGTDPATSVVDPWARRTTSTTSTSSMAASS
jgi:choline dehydrogenase-like flavoprotein